MSKAASLSCWTARAGAPAGRPISRGTRSPAPAAKTSGPERMRLNANTSHDGWCARGPARPVTCTAHEIRTADRMFLGPTKYQKHTVRFECAAIAHHLAGAPNFARRSNQRTSGVCWSRMAKSYAVSSAQGRRSQSEHLEFVRCGSRAHAVWAAVASRWAGAWGRAADGGDPTTNFESWEFSGGSALCRFWIHGLAPFSRSKLTT